MRVDGEGKPHGGALVVDLQTGGRYGIVDAIVNVEILGAENRAHAAAAHVRLIRQNERGGKLAHGLASALVVIADRGNHRSDLVGRHAELVENTHGHRRAALRMPHAVDEIADVVHIPRDLHELDLTGGIAHRLQNIGRRFRHRRDVRKAVFGVAERLQGSVRMTDVGFDVFVVPYRIESNHAYIIPYFLQILRIFAEKFFDKKNFSTDAEDAQDKFNGKPECNQAKQENIQTFFGEQLSVKEHKQRKDGDGGKHEVQSECLCKVQSQDREPCAGQPAPGARNARQRQKGALPTERISDQREDKQNR